MKTFIVEDDELARQLLTRAMTSRGYEVLSFGDAEAALNAYPAHLPELVMLDWLLPGMDGLEFCRRIRAMDSSHRTFVIVVTSRNSAEDLEQVLTAGADDYLAKPIDLRLLSVRLTIAERQIAVMAEGRRAEEALRTSEERYRLLAEYSTDMISRHAPDATFEYVSPASWTLLGYRPEELLGHLPFEFQHPDEAELLQDFLRSLLNEEREARLVCRLKHREGHFVWVEVSCRAIVNPETSEVNQIVCVSRDISERNLFVEKLRESEEKWRSLVENAPDIIMTVDRQGKITFISHVAEGHKFEEVIGKNAEQFTLPDYQPRLNAAIAEVFERATSARLEFPTFRLDGSLGWYAVSMGPVKDEGRVAAAILICTDVSERKQAQEAVLKEQRLLKQLLDFQERERQLVAFEIHDGLAQYLTGSLMHFEAFASSPPAKGSKAEAELERATKLLRTAVGEARRLISGLRPPVLDEMGIIPALDYLVDEAKRDLAEVEFVRPDEIERLNPQLESAVFRVVQEALTNVRRHSQAKRVRVEIAPRGQRLHLEIRDWGTGFDLDKVREGSFGLQGIRERARLLGGSATISSAPGDGTHIVVDFPLLRAES
jgi:PAS domain S-box-containing protein